MNKATIEASQDWNERRKKGKLKVGKLWLYTDNVPQNKPTMFYV